MEEKEIKFDDLNKVGKIIYVLVCFAVCLLMVAAAVGVIALLAFVCSCAFWYAACLF